MFKLTLAQAIAEANALGFPFAVQQWGENDYVVAHGAGDGIGKTVYATIRPIDQNDYVRCDRCGRTFQIKHGICICRG